MTTTTEASKTLSFDLPADVANAFESLADWMMNQVDEVRHAKNALAEAEADLDQAQEKAEGAVDLAADLVRHLHEHERHGGPVGFCTRTTCTEAVLFLRHEGVEVR